jgi:uncharacterized protein
LPAKKGSNPWRRSCSNKAGGDVTARAAQYVNAEKGVNSAEEALAGARDIVAEWVNENAESGPPSGTCSGNRARTAARSFPARRRSAEVQGLLRLVGARRHGAFHRVLAMRRGEKKPSWMLDTAPGEEAALELLEKHFVKAATRPARSKGCREGRLPPPAQAVDGN